MAVRMVLCLFACFILRSTGANAADHLAKARQALDKGIQFYHSLAIQGGFAPSYTLDLQPVGMRQLDPMQVQNIYIDVSSTGLIGSALLRASQAAGEPVFLQYAGEVARALVRGQHTAGGWGRRSFQDHRSKDDYCDLWYSPTRNTLLFLMAYDQVRHEADVAPALERGLAFMMESQFESGAWPCYFPRGMKYPEGNADCFSFNDGTSNKCLAVMIEAHKIYKKPEYLNSATKAADFIRDSQLPPPQSGWAQQYNLYLQPAWYRHYEPPSVCSLATRRCLDSLIDFYLYTGVEKYLDPVRDALRWLKESQLPNGLWARFYELGTNKPLYFDYGRKRVSSMQELSIERQSGYSYELDIDVQIVAQRFHDVKASGRDAYLKRLNQPLSRDENMKKLQAIEPDILQIIASQDERGRWVSTTLHRYLEPGKQWVEWDGRTIECEILSNETFLENIEALSEYIELAESLK